MKQLSQEEVKYFIETESNSDCKLLNEYKNYKLDLLLECKCGNEFSVTYRNFLKGKQYCDECGDEIFRLKKEQQLIDYLKINYNDEFILVSPYVKSNKKVIIRHAKCNKEFSRTPDYIYRHKLYCEYCYKEQPSPLRKYSKEFRKEFDDLYKGKLILLTEYTTWDTKVIVKCLSCNHIWQPLPFFILKGNGCPECNKQNFISPLRKTHEEFVEKMYNKFGDEYTILGTYELYNKPIEVKHNVCGHIWSPIASNLYNGCCPICRSSKGEKEIKRYLDDHNINYIQQFYFDDCRGFKYTLKYDFAILDENFNVVCVIEYDGEFHFKENNMIKDPIERKEKFELVKERDVIKNEYCKNNDILLLRIRYWEFNNVEIILDQYFKELSNKDNSLLVVNY